MFVATLCLFLRLLAPLICGSGDNTRVPNHACSSFARQAEFEYGLGSRFICIDTFSEMLSAGITTVGEFHYVHHSNKASSDGFFDLDMAVIEAACEVGIRLVLIETLYMRAGFSQPEINPEQWRFSCATVEQFIEHVEDLREKLKNNDLVTMAIAVHSLRAVPIPEAIKLYQYAQQNNLPLHLHLEEQPAELDDCRLVNEGKDPAEVLLQNILENGETEEIDNSLITVVHCTHTKRLNLDEFVKRKINVCICPCTEGYLGDGIPNLNEFDNICLGTDCNNRIVVFMIMRTNCRNCAYLHAEKLFECATINGAKSLGLISKIGNFVIGKQMDFFGILLKNFKLKNFCDDKKLLDSLIFGGGNEEIGISGIGGIVKFNK
uniref:Amidohydrolase-related domain-containing protein n=1 Tax=Meloidogyne floridensis TaxID=298350 RepID=A0A915NK87_9BILA